MAPFPSYKLPDHLGERATDIIALGNAKLEMILQVPTQTDGWGQRDSAIPLPIYSAGGCATNVACVAARLGAKVSLVCRLGDGRYSQPVFAEIMHAGVDTAHVIHVADSDGNLLIIQTNPEGDWSVLSYQDPQLLLQPEDIPTAEIFARAKIVHIDGFSLETDRQKQSVELAIARAHQNGCLVSIDAAVPMAMAQPDYLAELFKRCDLIFANQAEAREITRTTHHEETVAALQRFGAQLCCLKMGAAGSVLITANAQATIPAFKVPVIDTLAAGDSFIAALLTGLVRDLPLNESGLWGNAAGALACQGAGSLTHRFTLTDVKSLVTRLG